MYSTFIYLSYKSWRHELLPRSFQTGWKSFRDKDTIMMIFFFAIFGFLEIILHVVHVCYFQIIDGKNHWYVCSFLWSKTMWFVNLVEYQWITCIVNQDRCFLLLVSKLSAGTSFKFTEGKFINVQDVCGMMPIM